MYNLPVLCLYFICFCFSLAQVLHGYYSITVVLVRMMLLRVKVG